MIEKLKKYKGFLIALAIILIFTPLAVLSFGNEGVAYYCFYQPAYKHFGGGFYFPALLQVFKQAIFILIVIIAIVVFVYLYKKKPIENTQSRRKYFIFIYPGLIALFVIYIKVTPLAANISDIISNRYKETEVDLVHLHQYTGGAKGGHPSGCFIGDYALDIYQYTDLEEKKNNFILTLDNFDRHILRVARQTELSPLTTEDKERIIALWQTRDTEAFDKYIKNLCLDLQIKVKVHYLSTSKQVLKYEILY